MIRDELLVAARAVVEQAASAPLDCFLEGWPTLQVERTLQINPAPRALPVLRWLESAVRAAPPGPLHELAAQLLEHQGELSWRQTYQTSQVPGSFLERYGWCEIFGPGAPIACEPLACGVLLLGPETHYPAHRHRAVELYVPLSGTAWWQRGETPFVRRAPGEAIHHASLQWHAMRTDTAPLLALYLWSGEGLGESAQLASPPQASSSTLQQRRD